MNKHVDRYTEIKVANISDKISLLSVAQTPPRLLAGASDVANFVSFLASDNSNYFTFETIRINSGKSML